MQMRRTIWNDGWNILGIHASEQMELLHELRLVWPGVSGTQLSVFAGLQMGLFGTSRGASITFSVLNIIFLWFNLNIRTALFRRRISSSCTLHWIRKSFNIRSLSRSEEHTVPFWVHASLKWIKWCWNSTKYTQTQYPFSWNCRGDQKCAASRQKLEFSCVNDTN